MEREGKGEREMKRRGIRGRGKIMALFLIINILMISCGNGGPVPKEGEVATASGAILNLKEIGSSIKNAVEFMIGIEEVDGLVKAVGEIAKGIGNKVTQSTGKIATATAGNNNGLIIVSAYNIISTLKDKVGELVKKFGISDELKTKLNDVSLKSQAFLDKIKGDSSLCQHNVTDEHAKQAIDIKHGTKEKGASELEALNGLVAGLVDAARNFLNEAYKAFEVPAKTVKE